MAEQDDKEKKEDQFLNLDPQKSRGKFKIYIGMSAGVGKTYRMLQEAHSLLQNGVNIKVGYVETHGRKETQALIEGLPVIPRREVFYKGKRLEEFQPFAFIFIKSQIETDLMASHCIYGSPHGNAGFIDV